MPFPPRSTPPADPANRPPPRSVPNPNPAQPGGPVKATTNVVTPRQPNKPGFVTPSGFKDVGSGAKPPPRGR